MHRCCAITLFWITFLIPLRGLQAQVKWDSFEIFTTRNGLPHNAVLSVFQDHNGFLWVGTFNGLCRYDGNEFKLFREELYPKERGWVYSVDAITEDRYDHLWVGTRGGLLACMDQQTGKWTVLQDLFHKGLSVTCLFADESGKLWIGTRTGWLCSLDKGDSVVRAVHHFSSVISFVKRYDRHHICVLATGNYLFDERDSSVSGLSWLSGMKNWDLRQDVFMNDSLFFVGVADGSAVFARRSDSSFAYVPSGLNRKEIMPLKSGVSVTGGFYQINRYTIREFSPLGRLENQIELAGNGGLLTGEPINCISDDRSGIVWIGTNYGLVKIDKHRFKFKNYSSFSVTSHIDYNYIRSLCLVGNRLWCGVKQGKIGCLELDTAARRIVSQRWYQARDDHNRVLPYVTTNTLVRSRTGVIWAGGLEGLFFLKPGSDHFSCFKGTYADGKPLGLYEIWDVYEDKNGWLWVATHNQGVFFLHPQSGRGYPCKSSPRAAWTILERKDGSIWVGGTPGIYQASVTNNNDYENLVLQRVDTKDNHPAGEHIWNLLEDNYGNLWIGTTDRGISKLSHFSRRFTSYLEKDGLPDNVVCGILGDESGNLWISTVNGLSRFNPVTGVFFNFTEEDGLISNDFNFKVCCAAPWGEMFWGTKMGISSFRPADIALPEKSDVPVIVTSLRVMGENQEWSPEKGTLTLRYNQNNLGFDFAILDYSRPGSHRYRYKLEGFDETWVYASAPSATYTNLPPGDYVFVVNGSPDGRVWSARSTRVPVHIKAAIWQRVWFWLLVAAVAGLLLYLRFRNAIKRERELGRIHKQFAELEMKALQAQMNPHFIFNAVNSIQHFIIRKDTFAANDYLTRFARLMRLFLEASSHKYVSLDEEIEMLDLYISLEKLRFEEKFDYQVWVDPALEVNKLEIPSMLLQPFVENAIIHGFMHREPGGFLRISLRLSTDGLVECDIDDNGIGRERARKLRHELVPGHISKGMKLVDERLKTYRLVDDIAIDIHVMDKYTPDGHPAGTSVKITIPLITYENESPYRR